MACLMMSSMTVEPVMFLFMMSLFMMLPTNQLLFIEKICAANYDPDICVNLSAFSTEEDVVQTQASHWILFFSMSMNIPGSVMSMFYGATSDRVGRKYIMILPLLGVAVCAVVFAFSSYYVASPIGYVAISAVFIGLSGSIGTLCITVISYLTDITEQSSRLKRFGILEAMVFIGGTMGLVCAGYLGSYKHGFTAIYLLVLALQVTAIGYILVCLPESLTLEHRHHLDEKDKPLGSACLPKPCRALGPVLASMRHSLTVLFAKRPGNNRQYLIAVQIVGLLSVIGMSGEMDLLVLFTKHSPLSWNTTTIGIFLALKNILKGGVLIFVMPLMFRCIGQKRVMHKDLVIAQVGLISAILNLINIAFSQTTAVMMLAPLLGCFSGLSGAVVSSFKTQLVEPNEIGGMFASSSFLETSFQVAGSVLFNSLYPATLHIWPGFSFLVMAGIFGIALVIVLWLQYDMKKCLRKYGDNVLSHQKLDDDDLVTDDVGDNTLFIPTIPSPLRVNESK